jgi:hypothetical protein
MKRNERNNIRLRYWKVATKGKWGHVALKGKTHCYYSDISVAFLIPKGLIKEMDSLSSTKYILTITIMK